MGFKTNAGSFIDNVFGKDIVIEVNGVAYSNFLSVQVSRSLETMANKFTVSGTVEKLEDFPISMGQNIVIFFHEISVLDGYVESIVSDYGNGGHFVTISGRDITADIVDGTVFKPLVISGSISLKALLSKLLSDNGVTGISVIDLVSPELFGKKDQINIEQGTGLFEAVDKCCAKRQVIATTDGYGNLVITRGGKGGKKYSEKIIHIYNKFQSGSNNVLNASRSEVVTNRYNKYIVKSQNNFSGLLAELALISPQQDTNQEGIAIDSEIRKSRVLTIVDEDAGDSQYAKKRAEWEMAIRKSRSFEYTCSVQGFLVDRTQVWEPNVVVSVKDERLNLDEDLIIRDVNFNYNVDDGSVTTLSCTKQDAYQIEPATPLSQSIQRLIDAIEKANKQAEEGGDE
tara:strand:- start:416 stop:1612 length:1197 start_codon:yes stop_codon:yes gene_type:complete